MKYLIFLLLVSSSALAETREDIQSLIGKFDPTAYVSEERVEATEAFLPLTPGNKAYTSSYTIYHSGDVPDEIKTLIEKKAKAKVSYFVMPKRDAPAFPDRIVGEFQGLDKLESSITNASKVINSGIENGAKSIGDSIASSADTLSKPLIKYILIAAGMLGAFLLVASFLSSGGIKNAANKLSKAFESSGSSTLAQVDQVPEKEVVKPSATKEDLPNHIYFSALSDLYWSQKDGEASYILSIMPFSAKVELSKSFIAYFEYLSDIKPIPNSVLSDTSYLLPKSSNFISNSDLTDLVKANPSIYTQLSDVRSNALNLTIRERLTYMKAPSKAFDFSTIKPSQKRDLPLSRLIDPGSVESEESVLAEFNDEEKKSLLSLSSLTALDKEIAASILSTYTAQNLATVWLAPPSILSTLETLLPEAKLKMLKAYLERVKPARGALMKEIVKKALEASK